MFTISTDKKKLSVPVIHTFLSKESYWAKDIPVRFVEKSIENSLCFGVYDGEDQIGFARIISDYTTFAYLADVFILSEYRGQGLSKRLIEEIKNHPDLQNLRRWMLATADAHTLYEQFGFSELLKPGNIMEIVNLDMYSKNEFL